MGLIIYKGEICRDLGLVILSRWCVTSVTILEAEISKVWALLDVKDEIRAAVGKMFRVLL